MSSTITGIYFIDSNYILGKVTHELIEDSDAFMGNTYYITPITSNRALARKWLLKEKITIITQP